MKEQLELLLNTMLYFKSHNRPTGLCLASIDVAGDDSDLLHYIQDNRPSKTLHPHFFDNEHYNKCLISEPLFYWPLIDIDVRIKFIKHLISLQ